jgi:hypothetical protein
MSENIDKAIAELRMEIETVRRRLAMLEARAVTVGHTGPPPRDRTDETIASDRRLIQRAERAIELLKGEDRP